MTNSEAKNVLEAMLDCECYDWKESVREALQAGIEALGKNTKVQDEKIDITQNDVAILSFMFETVNKIMELQGGYLDIINGSYGRGDLYNLACKLGVEDYY